MPRRETAIAGGNPVAAGPLSRRRNQEQRFTSSIWNGHPCSNETNLANAVIDPVWQLRRQQLHMHLRLVDHKKFLLVSRGFHWIQEHPFNR